MWQLFSIIYLIELCMARAIIKNGHKEGTWYDDIGLFTYHCKFNCYTIGMVYVIIQEEEELRSPFGGPEWI